MLLTHPLMMEMMGKLFSEAQQALMDSPLGGLTATAAHARMQALRDIRTGLQSALNDEKMQSHKPNKAVI